MPEGSTPLSVLRLLVAVAAALGIFTTAREHSAGNVVPPVVNVPGNTSPFRKVGDDMGIAAGTVGAGAESTEQFGDRAVSLAEGDQNRSQGMTQPGDAASQ